MSNAVCGSSTKETTLKPGSLVAYSPSLQKITVGRSQASTKWGRDEERDSPSHEGMGEEPVAKCLTSLGLGRTTRHLTNTWSDRQLCLQGHTLSGV